MCGYFKHGGGSIERHNVVFNKMIIIIYLFQCRSLVIAQLVERWTVVSCTHVSIGHWFDSGSRDILLVLTKLVDFQLRFSSIPEATNLRRWQNWIQKILPTYF